MKDKFRCHEMHGTKCVVQPLAPRNFRIEFTSKGKMKLLSTGKTVKYTVKGDQVTVTVPKGTPQESLAFMFQVKP